MVGETSSAANKCVLAIDLGSGGPKVGLVDESGRVLASAAEQTKIHLLPNGGAEQDAREWWHAVSVAAKRVIHEAAQPAESIAAVSVTTQWSVIVPVNKNGQPLMNAVHWMDTRGGPYNRAITRGFPSVQGYDVRKLLRWISLTGLPPTHSGVDALGHMLFIKNERPDVYQNTYKFLEPMDYLNLRLTGKFAGSQISVMPMILTDNRSQDCRDYDPWLLKVSGIDKDRLPELLPNDAILGPVLPTVASDWGLSPDTLVVMSANDNQTAAIGAGAVADYDGVAVLGTSGYLACHLPVKKTDLTHLMTSMPSPLRGRYLLFAEMGSTGKVLDSCLSHILYGQEGAEPGSLPADLYQRMDRAAQQAPPGSGGVLFLPYFNGSLAPAEDQYMRGAFLNLSHHTNNEDLMRAVLEGISFGWRWMIECAEKMLGRRFEYLRLGGGGALSDTWAQIFADVTGKPIHQLVDPRNGNVLGAAFLAFHRLGQMAIEDIPGKVRFNRAYEPNPDNCALYERLFPLFLASRKNNKAIFHALNKA